MHVLGANSDDSSRELRVAGGEHEWMQTMWNQVAQQSGAIRIIFAPAEIRVGIKRNFLFHRTLPLIPINRVSLCLLIDGIIPLAFRVVAAIKTLAPNQRANLSALNEFSRLMPAGGGAALRADLWNLARLLDHAHDLEAFGQLT